MIETHREAQLDEALELEALAALRRIPEGRSYHLKMGLRHPLAIYNTSILKIVERYERMMSLLTSPQAVLDYLNRNGDDWVEELLERTDATLDALMEHMDDCVNVLRCLVAGDITKVPAYRTYQNEIRPYRQHIGRIVNHLKHGQGRLRFCVGLSGLRFISGYIVEGPDGEGALGPAPGIHNEDGSGAFSYARDLRLHVVALFGVSAALARAASGLCEASEDEPGVPTAKGGGEKFTKIILRVAEYPKTVFHDELGKPWPSIRADENRERLVSVEYPSRTERAETLIGRVQFFTSWRGDGVSRDCPKFCVTDHELPTERASMLGGTFHADTQRDLGRAAQGLQVS